MNVSLVINDEFGKDFERGGCCLFKSTIRYLTEDTEENNNKKLFIGACNLTEI